MFIRSLKRDYVNWKLIGSFFVFFFCLKTPIAQARENLVWQPASPQSQSNTTSSSNESVKQMSSEKILTAEELQDTFRALQLIDRLGLSFSSANQVQPMKEQLQQLQKKQSAPYQLSSAQLQTLRRIFSSLQQPQLTAINELLLNQKSKRSPTLTPKAIARLRENLQIPESRPNNLQQQSSSVSSNNSRQTSQEQTGLSSSQKTEVSSGETTSEPRKPTTITQNDINHSSREQLIEKLLVPDPNLENITTVTEKGTPAIAINVPSGFGATSGQFFAGLGFQGSTTGGNGDSDAAFSFGLGVGQPEETVGLDLTYTSFSTIRSTPFDTGGVSAKLHRRLSPTSSVAVGVENFIRYGEFDADISYYGSLTNIFSLRENPTDPFSSLALTVGIGSGRFRQFEDILDDNETVNIFGSLGLKVTPQFSLVGAYTGNTTTLGASVAPFEDIPLVITPAVTDLTGEFSDNPRFVLTIGYGTNLF